MIEIYKISENKILYAPRRIRKYVLVWCKKGSFTFKVDENEFTLKSNTALTITSGQIHSLVQQKNAEGLAVEFTYDFFCKDDNDLELIFHNSLFCHFAMNEVINLNNSNAVDTELTTMQNELIKKPYQYLISLQSRLKLILVELNRQKILDGGEIWKPNALFLKFLEAIRENFDKNPKVKDISAIMKVSIAKLNEQAKLFTGRTAQSVISGLIASEAKRLLMYEKLSVKETAYALGFNDPFYFSNFFKNNTGITPKDYLKKATI